MKTIKNTLNYFIPGTTTILLVSLQLFLLNYIESKKFKKIFSLDASTLIKLVLSFITLIVLSLLIENLLKNRRWTKLTATWILAFLQIALFSYLRVSREHLFIPALFSNIEVSNEAIDVALSYVKKDLVILAFSLLPFLILVEFTLKPFKREVKKINIVPISMLLLIYALLIHFKVPTHDVFANIIMPINPFSNTSTFEDEALYKEAATYPFFKKHELYPLDIKDRGRPNVIIIMMESFNAKYVGKKTESGEEITPYFNKLLKTGIYADEFYGNSIQTIKGHEAILCGVLPSYTSNNARDFANVKMKCLFNHLSDLGYKTLFYQAEQFKGRSKLNEHDIMLKLGFHEVESVYDNLTLNDLNEHMLTWGVEDSIFYERFFQLLDKKQSLNQEKKPWFIALATIANHRGFDSMKVEKRAFYKSPGNLHEMYANSIKMSDDGLMIFMNEMKKRDYLKNTIVVITGDHSYPTGDHGMTCNEIGFYREQFRTPLLITWDGKLKERVIKSRSLSQIDIAPTIFDLLGLQDKMVSFVGTSIFRDKNEALLIQPYNGMLLGVTSYPYYYFRASYDGTEYLFDMSSDPDQNINLITNPNMQEIREKMHGKLKTIYLNEIVRRQNLFYK